MVESKQVRVDNWGVFFLQRLQVFFSKTDYCDLTLQFEGNVQLKVHRLVMCACTEYFSYLERSCPAHEENTIMMPPDLQADVIVPIVNFMYTGMLEFHMSIFDRLYKAAELMNITVLTKLLDAQKVHTNYKSQKKKTVEAPHIWNLHGPKTPKATKTAELPATLPGRKLPVWKRKNVSSMPMQHPTSQLQFSEQRYAADPLFVLDSTPKPTRFEWPDDDLPQLSLMDTSFEEISYTSKPLLTQEEEIRASTSFDDHRKTAVKSEERDEGESSDSSQQKRKFEQSPEKLSPKRAKLNDKENKEATINIKSSNGSDLDHTKIVSEILKKYPQLVKKNKNIRLKIMASGNKNVVEQTVNAPITPAKTPKPKVQVETPKTKIVKSIAKLKAEKQSTEEGPWICTKCNEGGEPAQEFVLYYLYRKHMTDIHNETFDSRLCKYCGQWCGKHNLMMYHLYTKHGLKPPASYSFPKCDQCPYIALSAQRLAQHKIHHDPNEMQCADCNLAFTSQQTLTAHIQITGHLSRPKGNNYDCQYCTKKLQSAINLFSHIKNSHLKEAKRDGIVILEENEEGSNDEEAEDVSVQKDKVKIISNVKVPAQSEQHNLSNEPANTQLIPNSQTEALNNVPSSIATSLGLVDIVVLDDNQQYILQQQEDHSGQSEFIIPDLTNSENHFAGQVITSQHSTVLPQAMLQSTGTDITSTDELVMVLTDHDYQDEQEGTTADNSNIVVLYSHPVDGQQSQFITSQGNLLVNSQTGMLEIRNDPITTTAGQMVVNTVDTTESIESIQREIESHREMKQDSFYEEESPKASMPPNAQDNPNDIVSQLEDVNHENQAVQEENINKEIAPNNVQVEHYQDQQDQEPAVSADLNSIEDKLDDTHEDVTPETLEEEEPSAEVVLDKEEIQEGSSDKVDGEPETVEEPMEMGEIEQPNTKENGTEPQAEDAVVEANSEEADKVLSSSEEVHEEENTEGIDVSPSPKKDSEDSHSSLTEITEKIILNEPDQLGELISSQENLSPVNEDGSEPMEVDGTTTNEVKQETEEQEKTESTEEVKIEKQNEEVDATLPELEENKENVQNEDQVVNDLDQHQFHDEVSESEYQHHSETDNSQYNEDEDDNSQSSRGTAPSCENSVDNRSQTNINQVILEDWDDTDSQQSEKQRAVMKQAAENVNKLMDDWEEEDEDDKVEVE